MTSSALGFLRNVLFPLLCGLVYQPAPFGESSLNRIGSSMQSRRNFPSSPSSPARTYWRLFWMSAWRNIRIASGSASGMSLFKVVILPNFPLKPAWIGCKKNTGLESGFWIYGGNAGNRRLGFCSSSTIPRAIPADTGRSFWIAKACWKRSAIMPQAFGSRTTTRRKPPANIVWANIAT